MADVEIKNRDTCRIAYVEHAGAYDKIPFEKYISELYAWAKRMKVMPGFLPFAIYDVPQVTSPGKRRSEIAITFKGNGQPDGNIKVKELLAMRVAVLKYKGPSKGFAESYGKLTEWITKNGYEWTGPAIEIYTKKPKVVAGETLIYAHIQAPIRQK